MLSGTASSTDASNTSEEASYTEKGCKGHETRPFVPSCGRTAQTAQEDALSMEGIRSTMLGLSRKKTMQGSRKPSTEIHILRDRGKLCKPRKQARGEEKDGSAK